MSLVNGSGRMCVSTGLARPTGLSLLAEKENGASWQDDQRSPKWDIALARDPFHLPGSRESVRDCAGDQGADGLDRDASGAGLDSFSFSVFLRRLSSLGRASALSRILPVI
jgi:hypothetical protein